MNNKRNFSGQDFDVTIADKMLHVVSASITITNDGTVGKTKGVPNGWITGGVSASGQVVLDTVANEVIENLAKAAGSYQDIPLFDMMFFAGDSGYSKKIEVFGVKLLLEETYNGESAGGSAITSTYKIEICSPDFIHINGIPYLSTKLTEGIEHVS